MLLQQEWTDTAYSRRVAKSAELTGIWEKKLREIERRSYDAATFLTELKQMVTEIVYSVLRDNTNRRVTIMPEDAPEKGTPQAKQRRTALRKQNHRIPKTMHLQLNLNVPVKRAATPIRRNTSAETLFQYQQKVTK